MSSKDRLIVDANEATATIAHALSEVIAIYPITPSSSMGELADEWSSASRKNLWGTVPQVVEMQSEGGAAGAVHGALQAGALATTFTASQGLLLMIPNLYKIAGELTPFCLHVSARTIATHALSIFGDHSDVMACRQAGLAMLCSGSVQEAHDFALISHAATLRTRVPFMHFFDGFRTSHELNILSPLSDDDMRALVDDELVAEHRRRGLSPDHPVVRGTAQNPDVFFQAREACNPYHAACPGIVQELMGELGERTGRHYRLFDYVGHPEADRVIVLMGSGAEVAHEAIEWMLAKDERVGVLKVRLYRPFAMDAFVRALPKTVKSIAVLDRTKEPGSAGEPLLQDVITALFEDQAQQHPVLARMPSVVGGRYGLSSKEFTPAMVKAVFDEIAKDRPRRRFTVGIVDDVTHLSLTHDPELDIEPDDVMKCLFYGLGADGTVSANKNSLKILGDATGKHAQGYFVYDSKKSGAVTVSHLRFSPRPIRSAYLVRNAQFVACHQFHFLDRFDVLEHAAPGGTFLLNAPYPANEVWNHLPRETQQRILDLKLRFFVVDAQAVAHGAGMKGRINTVMQACFFAVANLMPAGDAISAIKKGIEKSYGKKGGPILEKNYAAVDASLHALHEVQVPSHATSEHHRPAPVPEHAPDFVRRVTAVMMSGKGDLLPVSAFPVDGTWPTGTSKWEKRNIAIEIPQWDPGVCIQCNKCAFVCPHAAIRAKVYPKEQAEAAPATFKSVPWKGADWKGFGYTIQVAPEDCTGCSLCVMVCPAKDKTNPRHKAIDMVAQAPLRDAERQNYAFFLDIPEADRSQVKPDIKGSQFFEPLFEYSGACAGCGETPYIRLLTQLVGDRLVMANATGCSSIYGGNLPTTPYTTNRDGRGPAWANSLFEDNAEFGLGMRLAIDKHAEQARELSLAMSGRIGESLVQALVTADQTSDLGIAQQRERVLLLRGKLEGATDDQAKRLLELADYLVRKSVWIVGGDGWAYDIGYGGLDHVLSLGLDVNLLVLDTEVYSNTGGQASKSTPLGAAAKFAATGKTRPKKDLGLLAMSYGSAYVAQVAFGAKDTHALKAMQEAEAHRGTSLVIAYSPCIAHGYDLAYGAEQQKLAVDVAYWPLYRFDPRRTDAGENPFQLDAPPPKGDLATYMRNETRFRMVEQQDPERYHQLVGAAREHLLARWKTYERLAKGASPAEALPRTGD